MSRKRKKSKAKKIVDKPKVYTIKMPVYTTIMMNEEEGLFGKTTYDELIAFLKNKLNRVINTLSLNKKRFSRI